MAAVVAVAMATLAGVATARAEQSTVPVVQGVDLLRYSGRWHEIAAIPAWFQRKCAVDTTADYAPAPDGRITVVNACREADGTLREATGTARPIGAPGEGKLVVTFLSVFGIPVWLAGGDYWIMALDPDYRWSLVGHPTRDYAWILSRTPTLPMETLVDLRQRLSAAGYDPCRLIVTADPRRQRLCDL